jgi:uncharacterized membrane protein HdeD (DUF308 family)
MISTENASPTGGAWAAILGAAIGCACFGFVVDLAEMSKSISKALTFHSPTGDLSGKSTVGIGAWLLAWGILHAIWNGRHIRRPGGITIICVILVLLGLVLVFPPFVEMITGH